MKAKAPRAKAPRAKAPSLAAAKHLRALFESAAVRQKAHDARLDLQKRLRDHNAAIQQRMEAHRIRDMSRGDTPMTARVGRTMLGGMDVGARPRSRTPPRVRRVKPPPPTPKPPPTPNARPAPKSKPGPQRYDLTPPRGPNAKRSRTRAPRYDMDVGGVRM
jgi:hypothetical protein